MGFERSDPVEPVLPAPVLSYAPPVPHSRLHPLTLAFAAWDAVRGFLIPALIVIFLRRGARNLGWVPVAGTMGAAAVAWAMAKYFTFTYWVSPGAAGGELVIRSGVLSRTERHIPLARVQDVRLKQNPMHRATGVVQVEIETAGGEGAEARLSLLSVAEATRLREQIFARRASAAETDPVRQVGEEEAPQGSANPGVARRILRRVGIRELVLAGLTSNQVASGLAVVGAAFAFLNDLVDPKTLGPHVVRAQVAFRHYLNSGGPAGMFVLVLGIVLLLALVGLLISVVGSVLLFYGFELSLAGEDLYRTYGLFTRHASSLPRRRIQLVRVEEGLLRRLLRLATLRANTAGSAPTKGEDEKGDDVLLPVVRRDEVAGLLPVIFPDADGLDRVDWAHVSRRAVWRGTFRGSVVVLGMTVGAVLLNGLPGLVLLGLIAFVYGVNVLGYRNLGYAKSPGLFRTRRGWLSRLTHVVPIRNVQAIVIRQNPLDRRYGVATIQVDTAGQGASAGPHVANLPWAEAVALGTTLAHEASATRYTW